MLPVINGSPTEWQNLYTAIKEAEKLRQCVWSDGKTVISFDLQLYIKAIRLQQKPDIRDNFEWESLCGFLCAQSSWEAY